MADDQTETFPPRFDGAGGASIEGGPGLAPLDLSHLEVGQLLEAGADWLWETDSDLRFSWLSARYEAITGIPPARVIGRFRFDFMDRVLKGSRSATEHLADLEARRPFSNFVYELRGGRRECRWISISGFPRFSRSGTFLGYRGLARNVTGEFATLRRGGARGAARRAGQHVDAGDRGAPARNARRQRRGLLLLRSGRPAGVLQPRHAFHVRRAGGRHPSGRDVPRNGRGRARPPPLRHRRHRARAVARHDDGAARPRTRLPHRPALQQRAADRPLRAVHGQWRARRHLQGRDRTGRAAPGIGAQRDIGARPSIRSRAARSTP